MPQSTPRTVRRRPPRSASDLVRAGVVSAEQAYAATLVLARLHDRGVGFALTLEDMCEILGYAGGGRRPEGVPARPHRLRSA